MSPLPLDKQKKRNNNRSMTRTLTALELSSIVDSLNALNEIVTENVKSEIVMEWPESFTYTNPANGLPVGKTVFDMDLEEWVFEPVAEKPAPTWAAKIPIPPPFD